MSKVIRTISSGALQLSPHFYLSEFLKSDTAVRLGIDNTPDPLAVQNMFAMAKLMEEVRKLLGDRVISPSSCFRSPALNAAVGSGGSSDHLRGAACDFTCNSFGTPLQVAQAIAKSNLKWGQLIQEGNWVHLSLPSVARTQEVLTAHFVSGQKASYTLGL